MELKEKYKRLGMHTKVLLQLHLENPRDFDAVSIVSRLFDVFEELGLEEDLVEKQLEEGAGDEHGRNNPQNRAGRIAEHDGGNS